MLSTSDDAIGYGWELFDKAVEASVAPVRVVEQSEGFVEYETEHNAVE